MSTTKRPTRNVTAEDLALPRLDTDHMMVVPLAVQYVFVNVNGREIKVPVRLVAAAPELLEALKQLDMAYNHETLCRAKERARAAIAKAEGPGRVGVKSEGQDGSSDGPPSDS